MYRVTKYRNAKSPIIDTILTIEEVFDIIKNSDTALNEINRARTYKKGTKEYDKIKRNHIPTFRFNFTFNQRAENRNITQPTGLIYLDADYTDEIPESDFIFAKWKSLSLTGYGILVKVDDLSINNFRDCYNSISSLLNIKSDEGARKATQQTIQSYDPDIHINYTSKIYYHIDDEKVSSPIKKKGEECLDRHDTFLQNDEHRKVRFNNLDDYFKDGNTPYIVFRDEKEKLCIPFIPQKVEKGNRNRYLYTYLSQILALNPYINKAYITVLADSVNSNAMKPVLPKAEVQKIIKSIFRSNELGELLMIYNKERRIIFNPNQKLDFKEIMNIVNKELGMLKSAGTAEKIYECIEMWDFTNYGKITQKNVAHLTELSPSTIKRYWHNFKSHVKELNDEYKGLNKNDLDMEIECKNIYATYYITEPLWKKSA